MNPNNLNNQPQINGISPDTGDYESYNQSQIMDNQENNHNLINSSEVLQAQPQTTPNSNEKLIFWLKFEGIINYIGFGFCILLGILSIISIVGIFFTLPFVVTGGIYYFYRAKQHYKMVNTLKTSNNGNNILDDLRSVYKWSGIVNIISIVGVVGIMISSFLSLTYLVSNFNFSEGGNNFKSNPAICEKAPYSVDCSNAKKSQSSSSSSSSKYNYDDEDQNGIK